MIIKKTINEEISGRRLDEALSLLCDQVSKSEARRIIDRGGCNLNGSMVRVASRMVRSGDTIDVGVMEPGRFRDLVLPGEALIHEDDDLIALNKPAGVNTQRTPYQLKGTLEYWASEYFRQQGNPEPARVIHRLDRGTSGVMLFPKQKRAAAWLSKRFHDGQVEKRYLVVVGGTPGQVEWRVDGPIGKIASARYGIVAGGRSALTEFHLLAESCGYALVEARPLTGRTHQIRVHLQSCGLPIVGDSTYGGEPAPRMMLHCASLRFADGGGREIVVEAPLDRDFRGFLEERGVTMTAPGLLYGTVPAP
jgi:RluA family pseudouridine synthase